ncbi:MAG TPA: hypothetical protein ENI52_02550, partial [Thermoplasmata archaeon]|nr:hypothetical protein [Thermoplasmata archaeon]
PLLVGGKAINRYKLSWDGSYLKYDIKGIHSCKREDIFLTPEKILFRRVGKRLIATLDNEQFYALHTLVVMNLKKDSSYNLRYILALFNSNLMNFYYNIFYRSTKKVFSEIEARQVAQLPIKVISNEQQKPFIELVDKMLSLNKQLNKIDTNFDHYVNQYPRTKDTTLRYLMNKLPLNDKKVLRDHYGKLTNQIEGKIKEFEIIEEGEWLIFKVGYLFKSRKGKEVLISNVKAFKCRIEDENLRKFLYYSIKEYITPGKVGKGNIYERILKIKIPQFDSNEKENKKIIDKIMDSYLEEVGKSNELKKEIEETDRIIDNMVYELYGLTEEEIKIVEEEIK